MSILAVKPAPLVNFNGKRLGGRASKFAMLHGATSAQLRAEAKKREEDEAGNPAKRARLMLAAKANLHFSDGIPRGQFTIVDPAALPAAEQAEAEAAGFTSRTLVLHPDDIDRAIEQFSVKALDS